MKSKHTVEVVVTLILDDKETEWLKAVMQNPLHSNETAEDKEMRGKLFAALNYATKDSQ